jgi:uncharacterized protein
MIEPVLSGGSSELEWELESTTMRGTLVRPPGDGAFPGVVFVAGSGPTDRIVEWLSGIIAPTGFV